METLLLALAFVGGLLGLVIVGMKGSLYLYSRDGFGLAHSRRARGLHAFAARSVPVQVTASAGQSEINLGLSTDPSSRYARGGVMVLACLMLLMVMAVISILVSLVH